MSAVTHEMRIVTWNDHGERTRVFLLPTEWDRYRKVMSRLDKAGIIPVVEEKTATRTAEGWEIA